MIADLRLRKIMRDLWLHKRQTALVLLAIGISVFSVSVLARTRSILIQNLDAAYRAGRPPQVEITTHDPFDDDLVALIRALPQVQAAEGMRKAWFRFKVGDELWRPLSLIARTDYTNQQLNQIRLVDSLWPSSGALSILLERSALDMTAVQVGDTVEIDTIEDGQVRVQVAGLVYAPTALPSRFSNSLLGYTSLPTLQQLTGAVGYNKLYLVANATTEQAIEQVLELVRRDLAAQGVAVAYSERIDPARHPLTPVIQTTLLILSVFGILALLFSIFMVVNLLTGLLAQQAGQIGVMKALGFRQPQIVSMYLTEVAILGLAASSLAGPLGSVATIPLVQVIARQLNVDVASYQAPVLVYGLELFAGVLAPLLAALFPVLHSTRVTVRTAIQSGSLTLEQFGGHWSDQWLKRIRGLPPPLLYALRNLLRRKVRLSLTLLTLTLAGAIFITVMSLRAALLASLGQATAYWQQDITLELFTPVGAAIVKNELLSIPGVERVEGRLTATAVRLTPENKGASPGAESDVALHQELAVVGLPPATPFLRPTLLAGRWLHPAELNGLVINVQVLQYEPDLAVGQTVMLEIGGQRQAWQVVGLVTGQLFGEGGFMKPMLYVNYHYLSESIDQGGLANQYLLETTQHDRPFQAQVARAIEDHLKEFALSPRRLELTGEMRTQAQHTFGVAVSLVQFALVLFAVVGGLALMSMMSLSVLERTREIGIIRTLGGGGRQVAGLVMLEGCLVSLVSWSLAVLCAWPLSRVVSNQVGITFVNTPLVYHYPLSGLLLWLAITITLSILATLLPARTAARMNVRVALAFE